MSIKSKLFLFLLLIQSDVFSTLIFRDGFEGDFIFGSGFESLFSCQDSNDNDGDGLLNCYETNTQVYVDAQNTGTDPNNADTDGDAISDGDEVLGTLAGLDLPAMGANPLVKNILKGKKLVVSGVFTSFSRDELKGEIEKHGGKVASSVSGATDYLVAGENMGPSKRQKAEKLKVAVISEQEFIELLK